MQDKLLFEYAVIRIVPKVEREEFLNAGVILFCAPKKFLKVLYTVDQQRLSAFGADLHTTEITQRLEAFCKVCAGGKEGGPVGGFPLSSRFRWLIATRSTVLQTSKVHPGYCTDPAIELEKLFRQFVL